MKYTVTSPDGQKFTVNAPEGATQEQVFQFAKQTFDRRASDAQDMQRMADPTAGNSFIDNAVIGAGKAVADVGRGAGQWLGLVSREDVAEARRLDAPLMSTGGGKVGNIAGNVAMLAPTALIPGANTLTGAGLIGAATGALQPSESSGETAANIVFGGAGGAAGQKIANVAGKYVARKTAESAARVAQNAQKAQAAKAAMDAGYVIPPEDLGGGAVTKAVSGISGKIKTAQQASARNQQVTNRLAREAIGLPSDSPLTLEVLDTIRGEAGKAYQAVSGLGKLEVTGKLPSSVKVQESLNPLLSGKTKTVDASELVRSWKQANHDATAWYRAYARDANPETLAKAKGFANAAKQIDEFMTQKLAEIGRTDLAENLKNARVLIAKTHTVESALNTSTGDVSAQVLAKALEKGRPLSGGLKTAGAAGAAFPKATQALKETPKSLSPLDFATAHLGLVGSGGNPLAAAGLVARPAGRAALLSGPVQRNALANMLKPESANAIARLLQKEPVALPAGVIAGTGLANYLSQQ